jgi:hypothetical protein
MQLLRDSAGQAVHCLPTETIERFWKQVYEDCPVDDEGLIIRSFVLNDFLHARDELHDLQAPPKVREHIIVGVSMGAQE